MRRKEREAMAGGCLAQSSSIFRKTRNAWFVSGNPSHSGIQTTSLARMGTRIFGVRGVFGTFKLRIMDIGTKSIHTDVQQSPPPSPKPFSSFQTEAPYPLQGHSPFPLGQSHGGCQPLSYFFPTIPGTSKHSNNCIVE